MEKSSKIKSKKSLFAIEHDEELEKSAPSGQHARALADNLKQLQVGKGHIKMPASKFTYEESSLIFGNAKAMLKREGLEVTFKSKSHKENEEYDYLYIIRVS